MLTEKDKSMLIKKINNSFSMACCRIMITDAPQSLCDFFDTEREKFKAKIVILKTDKDDHLGAIARNSGKDCVLIFEENYWLISNYFTGTCKKLSLSKALIKRAS